MNYHDTTLKRHHDINHMVLGVMKFLGFTVFLFAVSVVLSPQRVQAAVALNPSPGPMPAVYRSYLENCDGGSESPAFVGWIALAGSPEVTTMTVPYGTASISLELHWAGAHCFDNDKAYLSQAHVSSAGPAGVSGIAGVVQVLDFRPDFATKGTFRRAANTFNYAPPGGFTSSQTHVVNTNGESINSFSNGSFICITSGGPPVYANSSNDFGSCPTEGSTFEIRVNVSPPPVQHVQGRIFVDSNNDGIGYDGIMSVSSAGQPGEPLIGNCGINVDANVHIAGIPSTLRNADQCTFGPTNYRDGPYYKIQVSQGTNTVNFGTPPDWVATTPVSRTVNVPAGADVDVPWFGIRPRSPNAVPTCTNGSPTARINWYAAGLNSPYYVDISTNPSFSGFVNRSFGAGQTVVNDAPIGFSGSPGYLNQGTQYWVRVWYQNQNIHSLSTTFTAINCDRPPIITASADCTSQRVNVNISDPDGGPVSYFYTVNGSPGGPLTAPTPINMSSYNQYNTHTVTVRARGVAGPGSAVGGDVYSNPNPVIYGISSTRACLDRDFTINLTATSEPSPPGEDEAPTGVSFTSGFTISYGPPIAGPGNGVKLTVTRKYFIKRGATEIDMGSPAADNNGGNPFTGKSYNDTVSPLPAYLVGDDICVRITVAPGGGKVDLAGNPTVSSPASKSEEGCFTIKNKPYFRVYGGDVIAGTGKFGTCTPDPSLPFPATILAYGRTNGAGASTQLAAFAMGVIQEFSSAAGRTSPGPPKGLSFANDDAGQTYGGTFGASSCNKDFYDSVSKLPTAPQPIALNSGHNPHTGAPNTTYYLSAAGNTYLHGSGTIADGVRKVVYVNGDVFIKDNIRFSTGSWNNGNIPSFYLVVKGNIYIKNTVEQLDGVYVAQPDDARPNTGRIYTCARHVLPNSAELPDFTSLGALYDLCDTKLTVNGAFVAQRVFFLRTLGSLRNGTPGELSGSNNISEVFNYSPELWLGQPAIPNNGASTIDYDSITSLPPVL